LYHNPNAALVSNQEIISATSSHQLRFINIFTGLYVEEEALDGEGAASAGELVSKPLFLREDDGLD
jgi:hypothetical protein